MDELVHPLVGFNIYPVIQVDKVINYEYLTKITQFIVIT